MPIARVFALASLCAVSLAFGSAPNAVDSDHDGLSDELEQALLVHFAPAFHADPHDCAGSPALFLPEQLDPIPAVEDGTVYGQATPRPLAGLDGPLVELRYFHLWKADCGRFSHPLDAEHISVLVRPDRGADEAGAWKALYWYAAAHEDTVCDASQIARASTLAAEFSGAQVWISRGKHASFLNRELCHRGCGGDNCAQTRPLNVTRILNLGELSSPMNGADWIASGQWGLKAKLARSDFDPELLARLEQLSDSDIAWVYPGRRPMKAAIAAGGGTANALALSNRKTDIAISLAGDATGNALDSGYGAVARSLRRSARGVGRFLRGGNQ